MTGLCVEGVSVRYGSRRVVEEVDLAVPQGTVVGLVGGSGCGKSTLARAICGLVPLSAGQIMLDGAPIRRRRGPSPVQMIFQNPAASLNPRLTAAQSIGEALEYRLGTASARMARAAECLALVRLPTDFLDRRPGTLSGGQKQRLAIARALAAEPSLLVADEITSALDLSLQASILNLMSDLRMRLGLTILFISHNLAAVRYLCESSVVMDAGRVVDRGPSDALIRAPGHPYTRALVDAVPSIPFHPGHHERTLPA